MAKNVSFPFLRLKSAISRVITPRPKRDDKHTRLFHMSTSPEIMARIFKPARNMFFFFHSTDIRTKACSLSRHLTMVEPPMERHD